MTSAINSSHPAKPLAPGRAFWTTVAVGVSLAILAVAIQLARIFAPYGSHLLHAEFLIFIPMSGIFAGLLAALMLLSGAILFAGLVAAAAARRLGRVPFWVVCTLIPLCGLAIYGQTWWMASHLSLIDPPDMGFEYYETAYPYPPLQGIVRGSLILSVYLIPWLCGSWWLLQRHSRPGLPAHG